MRRSSDPEALKATLADLEELRQVKATALTDDFIDLGETEAFSVTSSEGECVA